MGEDLVGSIICLFAAFSAVLGGLDCLELLLGRTHDLFYIGYGFLLLLDGFFEAEEDLGLHELKFASLLRLTFNVF